MVCIYCRSETRIVNSRLKKQSNQTWRRHKCTNCSAVFTSLETPLLEQVLLVEDQRGHLEPFERDKLFLSVHTSLKHRKHAVDEARHLCDSVISNLLAKIARASISKRLIVETTSEILKRFDKAAYTSYLAFHPL